MTQELLVGAGSCLPRKKKPINICTKEMFEFSFAYYPGFAQNFGTSSMWECSCD